MTMTTEQFNARFPVGTHVIYHSVRGAGGVRTRTRSSAWDLGDGTPVVMVEGVSGGVGLDFLDLFPATLETADGS